MVGFIRVESTGGSWPLLAGFGVLALFIGGILLFFPLQSLRLMLSLLGIASLVIGLVLLAGAAKMLGDGTPFFLVALIPGTCALVLGVVVFVNPGLVGAFIALVLGFACLIGGLIAAGAGIFQEASPFRRVMAFASGILLAAIGLLVLLDPQGAAELAVRLAGLLIAALGAVLLAMGIRARMQPENPLEHPEYRVIEEG
jgi:uncharacterized membrane protein HdeD (DUF308 family)